MGESLLVRGGRVVALDEDGTGGVLDVRVRDGAIVEVGPGLAPDGEPVLDAAGGWVIPGLWDAHVHFTQYVRASTWVDVAGTAGARGGVRPAWPPPSLERAGSTGPWWGSGTAPGRGRGSARSPSWTPWPPAGRWSSSPATPTTAG